MKYTIEILDDEESYDPTDVEREYDLPAIREQARREGREYRGILSGHLVKLAPDVAEFFKTAKAVNEALRRVMQEMQDAA
jgi:hypothetical protein